MTKTSAADVKKARVTVEIDGEELTLIPSPDAIISLSAKYDGIAPLINALGRLSLQAAVDTVVAGMGWEGRAARDAQSMVARSSIVEIAPKLTEFAMILANGGRPLREDDAEKEKADPSRS